MRELLHGARRHIRGYTLVELMVAATVCGLLLTLAVPAFHDLTRDSARASHMNRFVRSLHLARARSAAIGQDVVVCKTEAGAACDGQRWDSGWMVFVNLDRDRPPEPDDDEPVLSLQAGLDPPARIHANRRRFVYRPFGRRSTNGTVVFCDDRGAPEARAVIVSYTGRPRTDDEAPGGRPLRCP